MTNPPPPTPGNGVYPVAAGYAQAAAANDYGAAATELAYVRAKLADIKLLIGSLEDHIAEMEAGLLHQGPPADQQ